VFTGAPPQSKTLPRLFWRVRRAEPCRFGDLEPGYGQEWGGASSPRLVSSSEFYGDAPSPPLLAHFPEPTLDLERILDSSLKAYRVVPYDRVSTALGR
jgi:hypothetical protein